MIDDLVLPCRLRNNAAESSEGRCRQYSRETVLVGRGQIYALKCTIRLKLKYYLRNSKKSIASAATSLRAGHEGGKANEATYLFHSKKNERRSSFLVCLLAPNPRFFRALSSTGIYVVQK